MTLLTPPWELTQLRQALAFHRDYQGLALLNVGVALSALIPRALVRRVSASQPRPHQ